MMRLNLDLIFLKEEGDGVRSISTQVGKSNQPYLTYTCQQAFTQVAFQRNPTIQSSFSDESEGGMRDSIDVSSHNSDVYGASCSSDESNAPTTHKPILINHKTGPKKPASRQLFVFD
ncbi:hypothetical protein YC2023_098519 [Brassica napus]